MDETAHMNAERRRLRRSRPLRGPQESPRRPRSQGLLGAVRDHVNAIGKCARCQTVVEPRLSTQWFVAVNKTPNKRRRFDGGNRQESRPGTRAATSKSKPLRFTPGNYEKIYLEWMNNIYDWCISRQLWWGHRIPAWHCANCKQITVARQDPPTALIAAPTRSCRKPTSSTPGSPPACSPSPSSDGLRRRVNPTPDLDAFYPTSLLVTGFDILFFWVARMIMLGCYFSQDILMPDGSEAPARRIRPLPRGLHPRPRPRRRPPEDVQDQGQRRRPHR
jgi:valyl-tRNA synthetase